MSRIPLKCHTNLMFNTKYTHPTLICRGTHAWTDALTDRRMHGRTENIYSIFRDKLLLLGEHVHVSRHQKPLFDGSFGIFQVQPDAAVIIPSVDNKTIGYGKSFPKRIHPLGYAASGLGIAPGGNTCKQTPAA
jgi:hypothetical protein